MAKNKNVILRKVIQKKPSLSMSGPKDWWKQQIRFKFKELPEAKEWKNGEEYCLVIDVKQTSSDEEGATFIVEKVGAKPKGKENGY